MIVTIEAYEKNVIPWSKILGVEPMISQKTPLLYTGEEIVWMCSQKIPPELQEKIIDEWTDIQYAESERWITTATGLVGSEVIRLWQDHTDEMKKLTQYRQARARLREAHAALVETERDWQSSVYARFSSATGSRP